MARVRGFTRISHSRNPLRVTQAKRRKRQREPPLSNIVQLRVSKRRAPFPQWLLRPKEKLVCKIILTITVTSSPTVSRRSAKEILQRLGYRAGGAPMSSGEFGVGRGCCEREPSGSSEASRCSDIAVRVVPGPMAKTCPHAQFQDLSAKPRIVLAGGCQAASRTDLASCRQDWLVRRTGLRRLQIQPHPFPVD